MQQRAATGSGSRLDAPLAPGDRYAIIDIVRGFSLFGVLVGNVVLTTQYVALTEAQRESLSSVRLDDAARYFTGTFVDGKFYTLFSMLFGLGFAVQLSRAARRGVSAFPTYRRRLLVLLVIGLLHGTLLWFGDVLHVYALLGFVLVLFVARSDRVVIGGAVAVALFAVCFPLLDWYATSRGWEYPSLFGPPIAPAAAYASIANGSYVEVLRLNWDVHLSDYGKLGFRGGILTWYGDILWRLLVGFSVGRAMLRHDREQHARFARRLLPWALTVGVAGNAIMQANWIYDAWAVESELLNALLDSLNELWVFSLSTGYACLLVWLYERPWGQRAIGRLAPVGRMALTNYLAHSVCMLALYYGIGLGLIGQAGAAASLVFCLAIFGGQVVLSAWWMRRFAFGPVEWVWRALTYGSVPKLSAR